MTTHHDVMHDPLVREHAPLIAQATETVADPQVRHRGTFGGALAHADPAGDLGAVALALGAEFTIAGAVRRAHASRADEFFLDYLTTAMQPDEILTSIRVPKLGDGLVVALREVQPGRAGVVDRRRGRAGQALERLDRRGADRADQHGLDAAARRGGRAALAGVDASAEAVAAAAEHAAEGTSPPSDLSGKADYREHLARVLTKRAVTAAAGL